MRNRFSLLVSIAACLVTADATAKTLYVAPTGSDATTYAANGASAPWATLGRAVWGSATRSAPNAGQAAQPGDVVLVAAGTYAAPGTGQRYDVAFNPANSGTAASPITFRANGVVTVRLSSGRGPVIGCFVRNYVTWEGFFIDEANALPVADTGPVVFAGSRGCQFLNNEIKGIYANYGWPDNHNGIRVDGADGTVIRGNRIHEIGTATGTGGTRGQNDAAVMLYDSNDTLVERNEFYDVGVGVFVKGQHPGRTQRRTIIRYNLIHRVNHGIVVGPAARDGRTYQNIVHSCTSDGMGIRWYILTRGGGEGTEPINEIAANNTIVGCPNGMLMTAGGSGNTFVNNILADTGSMFYDVASPDCGLGGWKQFDRNLYGTHTRGFANYESWRSKGSFGEWRKVCPAADANSRSASPRFVNAAAADFHLASGSPALTGGVDVLDLDGDGSTTDEVPIGAYVAGTEVIGIGPAAAAPQPPSSAPRAGGRGAGAR